MATIITTTHKEICWECNWFRPDDPDNSNAGACHWRPQLQISADPVTPVIMVWPPIADGKDQFCGQWLRTLYKIA